MGVGKMSMSESSATIGNTVKQTSVQYVKCSRAGPLVLPGRDVCSNTARIYEKNHKDKTVSKIVDNPIDGGNDMCGAGQDETVSVTNSSLELEMFKKQLKDKMLEVEQLKSDVKSKNENLQKMVKASGDQKQRFALEIDSLKDEIAILMRKSASSDSNVQSFKVRIAELQKLVKNKEEEYYIIKNKLDLVENVSNNKVKMYKEKLEESEKSKSSKESELRQKLESLQKDNSEKEEVVKSLESRIPKIIEEFTKYVEEKDSALITKEKEFAKAMSDKLKEVIEANEKLKYQTSLNEKYKKLLQSKDNELDRAQTDNLEIKEKLKEENKKNKLSSKELSDMKEVQKKLKKENEMKDKEIELKGKQLEKLEANLKDVSEKMCKSDDKNKVLEKLVAKGDSNYQKLKQELSAKTDEVTSLQIRGQKLTKKIKVPPVDFDVVMSVSSDSDSN